MFFRCKSTVFILVSDTFRARFLLINSKSALFLRNSKVKEENRTAFLHIFAEKTRKKDKMKKIVTLLTLAFIVTAALHATDYYKVPAPADKVQVSRTRYDYGKLANEITTGCTDNEQKIRAIYQWICEHISYDTDYRVRTADGAMQTQRGVCQAYCELFYQLAKAVGVTVEIINGISRDSEGEVGKRGHSWLFAYTRENNGILLDPTWGAGAVKDGAFTRSQDIWPWYNVAPEWMILSHFPEDESYQLLAEPMQKQEFLTLMPVSELWLVYGLNPMQLAKEVRAHPLELPTFYTQGEGAVQLLELPHQRKLRIGEYYDFRLRMTSERSFSIINNHVQCPREAWKTEADGTFSVHFMPRDTSHLTLCLRDPSGQFWNGILRYDILPPTAEDWKRVEAAYPLSAPDLKGVKHLDAARWERVGIDGHQLLQLIREQKVKEMPTLFDEKGEKLHVISVPMNRFLPAEKPVTFQFQPKSGVKWAIINNETWHQEWEELKKGEGGDGNDGNDGSDESDGKLPETLTMTVTPAAGKLLLYMQPTETDSFWSVLEYEVK